MAGVGAVPGAALAYPRAGVSGRAGPPVGWEAASAGLGLSGDARAFDRLAESLLSYDVHRYAGVRVEAADPAAPTVLEVLDGPLRGPCRLLAVTDESLVQGLVVGTLEGNRAVAEHRCHLRFDPAAGWIAVAVRTVWCPGSGYVLPGAVTREAWSHRRLVDAVGRALLERA